MADVKRLALPIKEIVRALEREADNTDTDPRWLAASCLRKLDGWEWRTVVCSIDVEGGWHSVNV